jgi:hypothetical protein
MRPQDWAVVDSTVGEDWDNVQLSLVAGAPGFCVIRNTVHCDIAVIGPLFPCHFQSLTPT